MLQLLVSQASAHSFPLFVLQNFSLLVHPLLEDHFHVHAGRAGGRVKPAMILQQPKSLYRSLQGQERHDKLG